MGFQTQENIPRSRLFPSFPRNCSQEYNFSELTFTTRIKHEGFYDLLSRTKHLKRFQHSHSIRRRLYHMASRGEVFVSVFFLFPGSESSHGHKQRFSDQLGRPAEAVYLFSGTFGLITFRLGNGKIKLSVFFRFH